jgi:predicted acyltransferase
VRSRRAGDRSLASGAEAVSQRVAPSGPAEGRDAARQAEPPEPATEPARSSRRVVALDAFRGLTIAGMILVNNPGNWDYVYGPLAHAEWNGWTVADLIFPFFLFIVGVAIAVSFADPSSRARGRAQVVARIIRRTVLLFALGVALNALMNFDGFATLRIPGVLQRIALCYLAASALALTTGPRAQGAVLVGLLVGYWALLRFVPVPGAGSGPLEPEHNLAAYLDRRIFGAGHLYRETWDPEGLLSTMPAVATTLFGVLAGRFLSGRRPPRQTALGMAVFGALLVALGELASLWVPINKNLWTSSFAVFTAGMALALFAVCFWLIDVKQVRRPVHPFVVLGMNPISVYVLSMAVAEMLERITLGDDNFRERICEALFAWWASPRMASVLFALSYALVWLGVAEVLYRKRIFLKL